MFNKNRTHLKLCQLILIFRIIEQIKLKHDIYQTFFCGDFNLVPNSSIYEFIVNQNVNFEASLHEFSNQKLGLIKTLEGNEDLLISLNNKYTPDNSQPKKFVRSLRLFENIITIVPILNIFGDEIIFCNIPSLTNNVLIYCFNNFFGGEIQNNYYFLKDKKKMKYVVKRRQVITHIINSLSKKINLKSSYSFVKSKNKNDASYHDVLVTQFGEDIKGIILLY